MSAVDLAIHTTNALTEEEVAKLASFGAKAFVQSNSFAFQWMVGVYGKYEENADVYDTFMRAWITAALEGGLVIVNESRTGFRCLYRPADIFHFADKDHPAGKSAHLDALFQKIDKDAFYERQVEFGKSALAVYGHGFKALKGYILAVDPEHQHKGIGKALQDYTERMAAKDNLPVVFCTEPWNLDMYKRRGYRVQGDYTLKKPDGSEEGVLHWIQKDP